MPRTRRERTTRLQARQRITRRRTRRATWIDLLEFHSAATNNLDKTSQTSGRQRLSDRPTVELEQFITPVATGDRNRSPCVSSTPQRHACQGNSENIVPFTDQMDLQPYQADEIDHEIEDGTCSPVHAQQVEQDQFRPDLDLLACDDDSDSSENVDCDEETAAADPDIPNELNEKCFPLTSSTIMALTLVCGSVRFSVRQYDIVRAIVKHATEDTYLPSYSTVQRKLLPHLMHQLFPRSELKSFPKRKEETRKSGPSDRSECEGAGAVRTGDTDLRDGHPSRTGNARVVFPTEWARMDISTLPYYNNIFPFRDETVFADTADPLSIEEALIVKDRSAVTFVTEKLFVEDNYGRTTASTGDEIVLRLEKVPSRATWEEMLRNNFKFASTQEAFMFTGSICVSWCVGTDTALSRSTNVAIDSCTGAIKHLVKLFASGATWDNLASQRESVRGRRRGQRFFTAPTANARCLIAGDLCTILRPQYRDTEEGLFCILVSRFMKSGEGNSSQFVIWVRVLENSPTRTGQGSRYVVNDIERTNVKGVPRKTDPFQHVTTTQEMRPRNRGMLPDGSAYVVYRALLYCDDFKESSSLFSPKSAGGVYLLPLGMTPQARSSRTAVHVVSLTPPGVSTNEVLLHIVPDIINGTKDGVDGVLPSGEKVKIFLDIVGFIADYPAAAETVDVIGHTGDSPCTHCNIRKFKRPGSSNIGHTTDVHAMNSASLRCGERHRIMRESNICDRDANLLGMKPTHEVTDRRCPLIALQKALEAVQNDIPLNIEGMPVVPGLFDAFRSNVVAPDHLLTGIARNILDVCFQVLSPQTRKEVDVAICSALAENGLIRERSVYDAKKVRLYSTSLSAVYCILLVSAPVLSNFVPKDEDVRNEALRLLKDLNELVALTQWKPQVSCDGEAASELINIEGGRAYFSTLQGMAQHYVTSVDVFCTTHPEIGTTLDKPNLHRLLELYFHTIPAFGHVTLVQELVFETAHQPLKRCVSRGNNREAEVSAVEHCLGNDWQSRLGLLQEVMKSPDERERSMAVKGLRRLLMGSQIDCIEREGVGPHGQVLIKKLDKDIKEMFTSPVIHILRSNGNTNTALAGRAPYWTTTKAKKPEETFDPDKRYWDVKGLVERGQATLELEIGSFHGTKEKTKIRWTAKRKKPAGMVSTNATPRHEALECGSVVQVMARRGQQNSAILRPQGNGDSVLILFVTIGFLEGPDGDCWAVAVQCAMENDSTIRTPRKIREEDVQLLLLTDGVRRVGVYHVCEPINHCVFDTSTRKVKHKEEILTGGTFRIQTRRQGYPPRMA